MEEELHGEAYIGPTAIAEPLPPQTLQETHVPRGLLEGLALKLLVLEGGLSILDLAERICLTLPVTEELCNALRKDQLCEVKGTIGRYYRLDYHLTPTDKGRAQALELFSRNQYAGPAPVPLTEYDVRVHSQSIQQVRITPADLAKALHGLVLDPEIVKRLGSAAVSGTSAFLYGPPGTGKTSVATRLRLIYGDSIWIPYAVEVDGQIITVFDAGVHRKMTPPGISETDRRWALCERPCVLAGGELCAQMLELQFSSVTQFYSAPLQMKANNGILIVDDFGRQGIGPEALLNRWMTPLDRRVDYLSLASGAKFAVPFDVFVIFATNLNPQQLADQAFQRRIPNKIILDYATPKQFMEIFRRECEVRLLSPDTGMAQWLVDYVTKEMKQPLCQSYPRDLLQQLFWAAAYLGVEPQLSIDALEQACRNYFPVSDKP
jgi:predicted ATPase with chaperone activity